jgi:hypothetical protein
MLLSETAKDESEGLYENVGVQTPHKEEGPSSRGAPASNVAAAGKDPLPVALYVSGTLGRPKL